MTPYELSLRVEVYMEQEQSRNERQQMLTYLNARLPLLKKFPEYDEVFKKEQKSKEQSDDDILNTILKLNAQLGGDEIKD